MTPQKWLWIGFGVFIIGMLAIDHGVINRKSHVITLKEASRWTAFVVFLAATFNAGIFVLQGSDPGLQFLTGYLI